MTTTEWVERYNRAFEDAACFQSPDSKFERQAYLPGSFKRLPPVSWYMAEKGPYYGVPSNPSPFDTHPGFDPQATDERALKGKKTPCWHDYYCVTGALHTICLKCGERFHHPPKE